MRHRILHLLACLFAVVAAFLVLAPSAAAQAQSNAGDLGGVAPAPQGALVPGATITARNVAPSLTRTTTSDESGAYRLLVLPPGTYEVTVEAKGFTPVRNPEVLVRIGRVNEYNVQLELRPGQETVVVTTETELIETQRTAVAETITPREIQNLPINQRDYLNFTLLTSNSARDPRRPDLRRPARPLQPGFGGRGRRHRQLRQRRALHRQPGGGAGVPDHHQQLPAGVRAGERGHRQHRDPRGHQRLSRQHFRIHPQPPLRGPQSLLHRVP